MKPAAFIATQPLGEKASQDLAMRVCKVSLTAERRRALSELATTAKLAFQKPLPSSAKGKK